MKLFRSKPAQAIAAAAALAMTSTPALARHWHRDRGIDGGDLLAGVLIIGGIAAVAAAASKANRDKQPRDSRDSDRYPRDGDYRNDRTYPDYRDRSGRYGDRDDDRRYGSGDWRGSMDGAVSACVGEVERGRDRVDEVDSVERENDGWRVEGRIDSGREFSCSVDRDNRIRRVTVDGRALI